MDAAEGRLPHPRVDYDTTERWGSLELIADLKSPVYFGHVRIHHQYVGIYGPCPMCSCERKARCSTLENRSPRQCSYY